VTCTIEHWRKHRGIITQCSLKAGNSLCQNALLLSLQRKSRLICPWTSSGSSSRHKRPSTTAATFRAEQLLYCAPHTARFLWQSEMVPTSLRSTKQLSSQLNVSTVTTAAAFRAEQLVYFTPHTSKLHLAIKLNDHSATDFAARCHYFVLCCAA
jgi:hypothetical protein